MLCCLDMDSALDQEVVVQTPKHLIRDGRIMNDISSEYFVRCGQAEGRYTYFGMNYCPFCGKPISLGLWAAEKKK